MATKTRAPVAAGRQTLTEKQRRFVEAYMGAARGNATEAARLAGYKGNDVTLAAVGSENLRKPQIAQAIEERRQADPLVLTREQAMARLSALGSGARVVPYVIDGVIPVDPDNPERELCLPAKPSDQIRALELLAKIAGWTRETEQNNDRLAALVAALGAT